MDEKTKANIIMYLGSGLVQDKEATSKEAIGDMTLITSWYGLPYIIFK